MGTSEPMERGQPRTILLVQSNGALRSATKELLEGFGHRVVDAAEPADAVAAAAGHEIELAVVEAYPRHGSGLELVRELRRDRPEMRALLLTAYGEDATLRQAVGEHEVVSLTVPFSTGDLRRAVGTALGTPVPERAPAPAGESRRRSRRPPIPVWAMAAAATLAAAAVLTPLALRNSPPPLATGPTTGITRSPTILPVTPRGEIDRAPETLRWEAVPGAESYRIEIRSVDGTLLWEATSRHPEIAVDRRAVPFEPAVRYSWRVEALDRDGRSVASSPRVWILVRPPQFPVQ